MRHDPMESSPPVLPQLSSYLPSSSSDTRTSSTATTGINSSIGLKKRRNSIEGAFSAVSPRPLTSHGSESELLKRKQSSSAISVHDETKGSSTTSFARLRSIYAAEGQADQLVVSSYSPALSSQDGDASSVPTNGYFASQPATTTPRRERTSRYLSEGDRREIITRIDGGEKQVTLAREFGVSRAAICNLYKNRWEVLTRGSRNPESKHPKKTRSKKSSSRQTAMITMNTEAPSVAEPTPVYPDVSTISIHSDESPRDSHGSSTLEEPAFYQPRQNEYEPHGDNNLSIEVHVDAGSENHYMYRQYQHHYVQQQDEADRRPRDQQIKETLGSSVTSRPFLVHEASAYSYPCRNLVAALRDESIGTVVFQQRAMRLARLLIEEALTCLPHEDVEIKNQFGDVCHAAKTLDEHDICGISMEDKGMVLLRAFSTISPTSPTGVVSIETRSTPDDSTKSGATSPLMHAQLPPINHRQAVLLLDISCATGDEACAVLHHLVGERHIDPKSIYFVTIMSSFEGLQNVFQHFPGELKHHGLTDITLD
ncbi:unnamed protein product [Phytophthora lilii]|uniref:Unnamed protein product n=1 Tax=Phytophthora lilii TaxID=2077276 RepID=A0A9W6X2E9_9STRA|nr:unnamed protein product [Phytophthora lilii]